MTTQTKSSRLAPFPMSGDSLKDSVLVLEDAQESLENVQESIEQIRYADSEVEAINHAEQAIITGNDFERDIGVGMQKLERHTSELDIPLHQIGGAYTMGDPGMTMLDNEGVLVRLRDVERQFNDDVMGVCDDIREELAPQDEANELTFFNAEINPRQGYPVFCMILEGLREYI